MTAESNHPVPARVQTSTRRPAAPGPRYVATRWLALVLAAPILGSTSGALRKLFERRAHKTASGLVEASVDGVRARKLGGRWRVLLGPEWDPEAGAGVEGELSSPGVASEASSALDAPLLPSPTNDPSTVVAVDSQRPA